MLRSVMLIDHLIYAHPDLDVAVADLHRELGVEAGGGGKHPGRGTHNKLVSLGPRTYLELIAPDPGQPPPATPRPYGVEGITQGGLVGWAIAVDDIEAARASARSHGFDPGPVTDGQREDATGRLLRWRVTANAQVAGLIPFLISWGDTPHPAIDAPVGLSLTTLSVEHPSPTEISTALAAMGADVEVRPAPHPALVARIDGPRGEREIR
ncbi:VOC family protein [Nocardioides sp. HM23]|uniref:VOC family protein n=1 Tax=Nocardioides bizhenqiangii TaxID=3095076 RepID=UPI002ACA3AFE|nr:VOC family protein [Nocardioides sp. HM23]MDZ5623308.1 VOC family protein [Nocardioides sp. HM23]